MSKLHDVFDIQKNSGYKFNKLIFRGAFMLIILLLLGVFYLDGFGFKQHIYIECGDKKGVCVNEYYGKCDTLGLSWQMVWLKANQPETYNSMMSEFTDLCKQEYIYGTYGTPQPPYMLYFNWILFLIVIAAFLINHLLYNKGWRAKDEDIGHQDEEH